MVSEDRGYIPELYGRRKGKALKPRQAALIESLLPHIAVPRDGPLDPKALFPGKDEFHFEIGFGGGEHLAAQAAANPMAGFIGAETYLNGVGKLLVLVDEKKLDNVRIHHGDARPVMEALPPGALARVYVFFPDPWPKARHVKRRMISPWFFEEAARLLKSGGLLRIASDIDDYIRWTLMHAANAQGFEWTAECAADWASRPAGWPQTRYEAKAVRDGRRPVYLEFARR